ncbi:hypothetical protein MNKW57_16900 [Biformimicrobium ophioploci]|uniref:Uncharacterized protein n=1 Tax=Biformimicrobium ophioploci TaxID=3036711 RepID=A0ABQ6LZ43_9GAMM|nr:hypothetical protein MNKW57_16900 [Microbulbifer sp. NKW57]
MSLRDQLRDQVATYKAARAENQDVLGRHWVNDVPKNRKVTPERAAKSGTLRCNWHESRHGVAF